MFPKTRIFYYDNTPSTLKTGDTTDLKIQTRGNNDSEPYLTVRIPSDKHEATFYFPSFDGVSAADGTSRVTLPKRNMHFRIPYHSLDVSKTNDQKVYLPTTSLKTTAQVSTSSRLEYDQTLKQLIHSYIPEVLQNNDNTCALYPGENPFPKYFKQFNERYSAIDCTGPSFNETLWQLDQRYQCLINRDITCRSEDNVLCIPLLDQLKRCSNDLGVPFCNDPEIGTESSNTDYNWNKLSDILLNRSPEDYYTNNVPKIFIHGVSIVDGDNSLVQFTFCCTNTWTLYVDITPRSNINSSRLQWRITYPYLKAYIDSNGKLSGAQYHQVLYKPQEFSLMLAGMVHSVAIRESDHAALTVLYKPQEFSLMLAGMVHSVAIRESDHNNKSVIP
ncbi:hypothetical protein QE152_g39754 [Popillia japonica]|uniref:Uncharacterized protein n=1 Tax=Popillia japonica TaxID=7064 RepID=A0AAW1HTB2_POPJA